MKKEFQEKLFNDFPLLYKKNEDSKSFYFECCDGWYKLIHNLSKKLYPLIEKANEFLGPNECPPKVNQVKEKYGTMKFYMDSSTEEMDDIIHKYEEKSAKTCQICGKPGFLDNRKRFHLVTTCPGHWRK